MVPSHSIRSKRSNLFYNKGEVIESSESGSGSFGFGEIVTYSKSWQIATDAKTMKARVSYFSKSEPVNLPCKLTFSLGPEP